MKNLVLTLALICTFYSFTYSQNNFDVDASVGLTHRPTELSGIKTGGFYVSMSPSIPLKNKKFRFRTTLQYRRVIDNLIFNRGSNNGNIDLSPELEYNLFNCLTLGAGIYGSRNLNSLNNASTPSVDLGPVASIKFRYKDAFATVRWSKPMVDQIERFFNDSSSFLEYSSINGLFQFGLGYTFGKK